LKEILLTQGQVAIVDDEDFEWLNQYNWCASWDNNIKGFYATRHTPMVNGRRTVTSMHRTLMNHPRDKQVDHINHDSLDNRKSNLRVVTIRGNGQNRRDNKLWPVGVSWKGYSFVSRITINKNLNNLGSFPDPISPSILYNVVVEELSILGID